ncbi:BamA/TamA family outer membrane protein [Bordetella genomosp. 5]|nr:BamA/TamA family outer membrane protein [Bordetella genomosp. 5]
MSLPRMGRGRRRAGTAWLLAALASAGAGAEGLSLRDPEDGAFDVSDFLLNHRGVMPVPAIITEPAVGYGGALMLLYFSSSMAEAGAEAKARGAGPAPPNITGVAGMMTENGSRGGGLFHFRTWDGDRYRYLGALAQGRMNLDYYGITNQARSYEIKGTFFMQQLLARIGDSRWYVGPRYTYMHSDTRFTGARASELSGAQLDKRIGKLGLVVDYDSRDNMFFPSRGSYAELEAQWARGWVGSDQNFDSYRLKAYTWQPVAPRWNLGLRADGQTTSGTVPFYAQPYIDLRGVSRGRYQDRSVLVGEVELRYNLTPRWSLLGFSGVGKAYGNWKSASEASNVVSVGAGFRYLIARKLGLSVGVDVAHSKDQNAFYIQVGSAWR